MSSAIDTPAAAAELVEIDTRTAVVAQQARAITVTFFAPGEMAKGIRKSTTWARLFTSFATAKVSTTTDKGKLGGWSPAVFGGDQRKKDNAAAVNAVVFDFDNADPTKKTKTKLPDEQLVTIERAMAAFPGVLRFAYTSWSHSSGWPHLRLIVPFSRCVTAEEQARIWAILNKRLVASALLADAQCKDASRLWYLPARRDEHFRTSLEDGPLLDVDGILGEPENPPDPPLNPIEPDPADEPETAIEDVSITDADLDRAFDISKISTADRLKRASKYLAKMPAAVSGAGGHTATFKAAVTLVRGFALPAELALVLLRDDYNPRCQPPWTGKDLQHKINEAVKDGKMALGSLLRPKAKTVTIVAPAAEPDDNVPANVNVKSFPCTDLGNAERLVQRHGSDLRFVGLWEKWIVWTGSRWQVATRKQVERFSQITVRSIYKEAADEHDPDRRKTLSEHARSSESNARKVAMIEQAKSLPGIPILPEDLDNDPWLLNVKNGTLDLRTGDLGDHCREDLITKMAGTTYEPDATCPQYDAFMLKVQPDAAVREHIHRLDGYGLTGVVRDHVLPIHYGGGSNGKGVHASAVEFVFGDYSRQIPTELLLAKKGDSHPTEKTTLFGIRLALAVESDENRALNVAFVKQATGGDRISARRMREDFWEFDPTHKIQLSTNHRPVIRETKHAIWRRVLLIPWTVTIPEPEQDKQLPVKLKEEAPGILAKLVRACLDWQRDGLAIPKAVRAATDEYRSDMDVIGTFIGESCAVEAGQEAESTALFKAFTKWAGENNERAMTQTSFGTQLTERGFPSGRNSTTGRTIRKGLRVLFEGASFESVVADTCATEDTSEVTVDEIERQLNRLAEGSEGSEPNSGFTAHESHTYGETGKVLQTLQTLQAASGNAENSASSGSPARDAQIGASSNSGPAGPNFVADDYEAFANV